jgi:hypothetical protein
MIKRCIKRLAQFTGFQVSRVQKEYNEDGLRTIHLDNFRQSSEFKNAYRRGLGSLTRQVEGQISTSPFKDWNGEPVPGTYGQWRVHVALWCASTAARIEGDFVECGVFLGFMSSAIMTHLNWDQLGRTFYLIDSFEGPATEQFNENEVKIGRLEEVTHLRKIGGYNYSLEGVKINFKEWSNVVFIKGLVPDSLLHCPTQKIAFLHLDMNCALPEVEALRFFWDKIQKGGVVLMDDYAFSGFDEQHQALNTVAKEFGVSIVSLPTGQGLIIKN